MQLVAAMLPAETTSPGVHPRRQNGVAAGDRGRARGGSTWTFIGRETLECWARTPRPRAGGGANCEGHDLLWLMGLAEPAAGQERIGSGPRARPKPKGQIGFLYFQKLFSCVKKNPENPDNSFKARKILCKSQKF
jgi:hypothetical protein